MTQMLCLLHYLITHVTPGFYSPIELADRSSSAAISKTSCKEPEEGSSNVLHLWRSQVQWCCQQPHRTQHHASIGEGRNGIHWEILHQGGQILLGRESRYPTKNGQSEGMLEGAQMGMCPKPRGSGVISHRAVCWGQWESALKWVSASSPIPFKLG